MIVSLPNSSPLWVLIPNALVPKSLFEGSTALQHQQTFACLPITLRSDLAKQLPVYHQFHGLDPVEAWLTQYLDSESKVKFDQYPPWAMLSDNQVDQERPLAFCRWWASVGHIQVERDGVRFIPAEALDISKSDFQAFWDIALPVLKSGQWEASSSLGAHVLLDSATPLLMEQASPWSVQNVKLTDYLPMDDACAGWRKMWLELQVELTNSEFNIERERRGLPALNCLWFWGGGHSWEIQYGLGELKSVSSAGVYQLNKATGDLTDLQARLVFWNQRLDTLLPAFRDLSERRRQSTIYAVQFDGWGGDPDVFKVLEAEVLSPMKLAGLAFSWGLLGQQGCVQIHHDWRSRLKFWKVKPQWSKLIEPDSEFALDEQQLRQAWEEGIADQAHIEGQWDRP